MHIDLFSAQPSSPTHHSPSKEKRPPQISVSKVFSSNHKWKECKIIGKNISIRSYSAACAYRNRYEESNLVCIFTVDIKYLMGPFMTSTQSPLTNRNQPFFGNKL